MTERGFIALARGILDHPVVGAQKPYTVTEAWLWLLLEAGYKPRRVCISNGRTATPITLERGQLSHSIRYMASAWGWTIKRVRTFLNRLENDTQIGTQTDTLQTIITICNYERYQSPEPEEGTQTGTQKGTQRARKGHKEEQGNKEITDNTRSQSSRASEPEGFVEWYAAYPRKKARKDAAKAFAKVLKAGEIALSDLIAKTKLHAAAWARRPKSELQFCPYPASWLNAGEYLDEAEAAPAQQRPASNGSLGFVPMKVKAPERDPQTFTESDWRDRLAALEGGGRWLPQYWGPAPGDPGCLVPSNLVEEMRQA